MDMLNTTPAKECDVCDFKNAVRHGRADHRCPNCGKNLILEMVLMAQAGIDYSKITPKK